MSNISLTLLHDEIEKEHDKLMEKIEDRELDEDMRAHVGAMIHGARDYLLFLSENILIYPTNTGIHLKKTFDMQNVYQDAIIPYLWFLMRNQTILMAMDMSDLIDGLAKIVGLDNKNMYEVLTTFVKKNFDGPENDVNFGTYLILQSICICEDNFIQEEKLPWRDTDEEPAIMYSMHETVFDGIILFSDTVTSALGIDDKGEE